MKTKPAVAASIFATAFAVSLVPVAALAGGLEEAQLMGIYQSCLLSQGSYVIAAALPKDPRHRTFSEFHNPLVGAAKLNIDQNMWARESGSDGENTTRTAHTEFLYHTGRLQISVVKTYLSPVTWTTSDEMVVETAPLFLPYYTYKTKSHKISTVSQLGAVDKRDADIIETKPQLMVYAGSDHLPFLNSSTKLPVRGADGKPLEFDVQKYKTCLTRSVDQAYAAPKPAEVVAKSPAVETAPGPKSADAIADATRATAAATIAVVTPIPAEPSAIAAAAAGASGAAVVDATGPSASVNAAQ